MAQSRFSSRPRASVASSHEEVWDSEYDSTWEDEERPRGQQRLHRQYYGQSQRTRAARDLQIYRHGYPQAQIAESYVQSQSSTADRDLQTQRHGYPQAQTKATKESFEQSPKPKKSGDQISRKVKQLLSPSSKQNSDHKWNKGQGPDVPKVKSREISSHWESEKYQSQMEKKCLNSEKMVVVPNQTPNLDFYQNKKPFEPYGVFIEYLLTRWKYDELEMNHSYIQWLFPLRQPGMNLMATPVTLEEIKEMKRDREVMSRFLRAYELMLGFYGIKLKNRSTGDVELGINYRERFKNLNTHTHNNLRITRILKCLGELGYAHFQAPLVRFFLAQTLCNNNLPNVKRSVLDYFMLTVKDKNQRRELIHFAWRNYKPQKSFIWGPVEKIQNYSPREERKKDSKNLQRQTVKEDKDGHQEHSRI